MVPFANGNETAERKDNCSSRRATYKPPQELKAVAVVTVHTHLELSVACLASILSLSLEKPHYGPSVLAAKGSPLALFRPRL